MVVSANTVSGHYCCVNMVSNMYVCEATLRSCNEVFNTLFGVTVGRRIFFLMLLRTELNWLKMMCKECRPCDLISPLILIQTRKLLFYEW